MTSVKRDDHFSSDGDVVDAIPLVSDIAEPVSPMSAQFTSIPEVSMIVYRLSWTTGGFTLSIKQIRFLNEADVWLFSAEPKDVNGNPSFVVTALARNFIGLVREYVFWDVNGKPLAKRLESSTSLSRSRALFPLRATGSRGSTNPR
jgi:hypothetical protein